MQSTEGAAQSAIQYFENMRNFLVVVKDMQLLTFEASDVEKVLTFPKRCILKASIFTHTETQHVTTQPSSLGYIVRHKSELSSLVIHNSLKVLQPSSMSFQIQTDILTHKGVHLRLAKL